MARQNFKSGDESRFKINRERIIKSQDTCALCGGYVDKTLVYPHPMSASVDHKLPISKGGTSELSNLQLAHWICNRLKSNKAAIVPVAKRADNVGIRNLPHMRDWTTYRCADR